MQLSNVKNIQYKMKLKAHYIVFNEQYTIYNLLQPQNILYIMFPPTYANNLFTIYIMYMMLYTIY